MKTSPRISGLMALAMIPSLVQAGEEPEQLSCCGAVAEVAAMLQPADAETSRDARLELPGPPAADTTQTRSWNTGFRISSGTELPDAEVREGFGIHGVIPGMSTRAELESNDRWGPLIRETAAPDGTARCEYRPEGWKSVTAVIAGGVVRTLDAEPPGRVPPDRLAQLLRLGDLTPVGMRTDLAPDAFLGPAVPEQSEILRGALAPQVLIIADRRDAERTTVAIRFFSRPSAPRPVLSFYGVTPGFTVVDELQQLSVWQQQPVRSQIPVGEQYRFDGPQFAPWSSVSLIVVGGVVQSVELTPGSEVTPRELADAIPCGTVVLRDTLPPLPQTAGIGTPIEVSWQPAECTGALVMMFLDVAGAQDDNTAEGREPFASIEIPTASEIIAAHRVQMVRLFGVRRAFLGTETQTLTMDTARRLGLTLAQGLLVKSVVPGSAADQAGIQVDDVLTHFAKTPLQRTADLMGRVQSFPIGSRQQVELVRQGRPMTLGVQLQSLSMEVRCLQLGGSYFDAGLRQRAEAMFTRALEANPESIQALSMRARVRLDQGEPESGLRDVDHAIQLYPQRSDLYLIRAMLLAWQKRFDEALAACDQAREVSESAAAYATRGNIHRFRGDSELALADLRRAVEMDPECTAAYLCRGGLFFDQKQFQAALPDLERVVELEPNNFFARHRLGATLALLGQFDRAAAVLERLVTEFPAHDDVFIVHRDLARICVSQGNLPQALGHVQRTLELKPDDTEAVGLRDAILTELQKPR